MAPLDGHAPADAEGRSAAQTARIGGADLRRSAAMGTIGLWSALFCAACATAPVSSGVASPSPTPPSVTGAPAGTAPSLTGFASIDGAYRASGSFSIRPEVLVGDAPTTPSSHDTCANYAGGFPQNPTSFTAPELQTSGNTTLYLRATIAIGYHGPGTYTVASTSVLRGTLTVGIGDLAGAGYIDTFRSGFAGTTTLTVKTDGSGMLAFTNWSNGDVAISGNVTWTCR
jgi:hypothetical protein